MDGVSIGATTRAHQVVTAWETEERWAHVGESLHCDVLTISSGENAASKRRPTSAMSIRIPFSLPLYVGGKSENMAKWIVWPEAAPPSTMTKNSLLRSEVEVEGLKENVSCFQDVWEPESVAVADPRVVPLLDRSPTVTVPEKDDEDGK